MWNTWFYLTGIFFICNEIEETKYFAFPENISLKNEILRLDLLKISNNIAFPFPLNLSDDDTESEIIFRLFTRKKLNIILNKGMEYLNSKHPIKVIIHGWNEHAYVDWIRNITRTYLNRGYCNVISVDWSSKSDTDYLSASMNVKGVGDRIGDYLINLHKENGVPYKNIHLVSHSLGCHVAGYVGKRIFEIAKMKIARITALDPAAPIFDLFIFNDNDRLSKYDANFVDVLHTDGGMLGFSFSIGTVDFYPNGGYAIQPGCSLAKTELKYEDFFCSHTSSHQLYIKSINSRKFSARSCSTWEKFSSGLCNNNSYVIFGEDVPLNALGNYFFRTAEKDLRI